MGGGNCVTGAGGSLGLLGSPFVMGVRSLTEGKEETVDDVVLSASLCTPRVVPAFLLVSLGLPVQATAQISNNAKREEKIAFFIGFMLLFI